MKDKILFLIIGILIGAIITTAGFLIYNSNKSSDVGQPEMMKRDGNTSMGGEILDKNNGEEPPAKPDGDDGEEPPAKPDGDDGEEPPAKPEESNDNTNS